MTSDETSNALEVCLTELDSCRPFFLGLLGERYFVLLVMIIFHLHIPFDSTLSSLAMVGYRSGTRCQTSHSLSGSRPSPQVTPSRTWRWSTAPSRTSTRMPRPPSTSAIPYILSFLPHFHNCCHPDGIVIGLELHAKCARGHQDGL